MSALAKTVFLIAVFGGLALWGYGAVTYARTLAAIRASEENAGMTWHAIFNWLFASRHLKGEAAVHAHHLNRVVHAFLICVIVAAAAAIFTAFPSGTVR
jgi:hypothetical protein